MSKGLPTVQAYEQLQRQKADCWNHALLFQRHAVWLDWRCVNQM